MFLPCADALFTYTVAIIKMKSAAEYMRLFTVYLSKNERAALGTFCTESRSKFNLLHQVDLTDQHCTTSREVVVVHACRSDATSVITAIPLNGM